MKEGAHSNDWQKGDKRFQALMNHASDAITLVSNTGEVLYQSPSTAKMLGYSMDEIKGQNGFDLIHPDDLSETARFFQQILTEPGVAKYKQHRVRKKDGTYIWTEGTITNLLNDPDVNAIVSNFRDITEHKLFEKRIIQSENKYRNLFENNPMPMWILNASTYQFMDVNTAAIKHYGYSREEFLAMTAGDIRPEDEKARFLHLNRSGPVGPNSRGLWKHLKKDGSLIYVDIISHILQYEGKPAMLILSNDVSDKIMAEEKLARSEKLFRSIVLNIPQAVVAVMDKEHRFIMVEGELTHKMGYIGDDFEGKHASQVLPPERYEYAKPLYDRMLLGERLSIDWQLSGSYYMVHFVPLLDEDNSVYAGMVIVLDVTQLKKVEMELNELNRNLEHKVEERTRELQLLNKELEAFSFSVSHDLKAPLRIINGLARVISEDEDKLGAESKASIANIGTQATKMTRLIEDLLKFARLGNIQLEKRQVDMHQLALEALGELEQGQPHRAAINWGPLPIAYCDNSLVRQVWLNLLSNALKYSADKENPIVEINAYQTDKDIVYYVKDNGAGFDMKYAGKLFGVFQRLHKASQYEGTGIGLALVQRIINKHDGNVWAEAKLNEGATFYFSLPIN